MVVNRPLRQFIACSGYPECKTVKKIVNDTGALCPKCGGKIIEKKSKRGRVFYGCDQYPKCDFVVGRALREELPGLRQGPVQKKDKAKTCTASRRTAPTSSSRGWRARGRR